MSTSCYKQEFTHRQATNKATKVLAQTVPETPLTGLCVKLDYKIIEERGE